MADLDRYYRPCPWCDFPMGISTRGAHHGCTGQLRQQLCGANFDLGRAEEELRDVKAREGRETNG